MAATTTRATPKRRAPAKRKPAARTRTTASKTTARSTSTRPATRAARAQRLAERAVQIPVGAALEARDRLAGTIDVLEREVRRTRTQLEHRTRGARRGFERQRTQVRKSLDLNVEVLSTRVEPLKTGVEKVVQNGVGAGMKLVNGVQERLPKAV